MEPTQEDRREGEQAAGLVQVLLSTHNGARFLAEQIDSILAQTTSDLRLIVRDDGSSDETVAVLRRLSSDQRMSLVLGHNVGAAASFFSLLYDLAADAEYTAFCDQDDVWLADKIERAVRRLHGFGTVPALYCARAKIVDEALRPVGETPLWSHEPCFGNALVENVAMGCTVVLNRAALRLIRSAPRPAHAIMHDWWCYLVVSALGRVVFDPEPALLYRQHAANTVGVAVSAGRRTAEKLARQLKQDSLGLLRAQAGEFARCYREALGIAERDLLDRFLGARTLAARFALARDRRLFRQLAFDDTLLRLRLLLG